MERLIKNEILPDIDFTDLNICVNCIKGKLTNIQRKEPQEALSFLKLCILIFENILMLILSERKDNISPLLMNIHVTFMSTYCMRNLRQWIP